MPSFKEPSEFPLLSALLTMAAAGLFMAGWPKSGLALVILAAVLLIGDFLLFGIRRK